MATKEKARKSKSSSERSSKYASTDGVRVEKKKAPIAYGKETPKDKELHDALTQQTRDEIAFARKHKQQIITNRWHKNENLVYLVKPEVGDERANIGVANTKAQGFMDSLLSKIDNPIAIKYIKGEEADLNKARYANAVIDKESKPSAGNWAMKDLLGKKQGILYGRVIYEFHGSSKNGFKTHFTNVDAYDFLIDPAAGGLDIENGYYMGRGGVYKTKEQLEEGAESKKYLADKVKLVTDGKGGSTNDKEEQQKQNRYAALVQVNRVRQVDGQYKFWEWYTTYKGERYYVLYNEEADVAIRICKLKDIFESNLWPFVTWAVYPDLVEFWTPAPMDYVREIYMGQGAAVNQLLDNGEAINRPMKYIQVGALKNPNQAKYGRDKIVKVNKGVNVDQAIKIAQTPSIDTPAKVYEILEGIGNVESGINAATKGVAEEDKVGIYEGNLANVSDRLGLLNKSYSNAYHRLGLLFYHAILEHMTEKTSIEMVGADGIEFVEIKGDDIKPERRMFDISTEASDAETQNDLALKKTKITFLEGLKGDQSINQKARFEMAATIAGLEKEEVKRLLDVEEFGTAELMSEAARDIQRLLLNKSVTPNESATVAYAKKIIEYMWDNKERMDSATWKRFESYVNDLKPIVVRNMAGRVQDLKAKAGELGMAARIAAAAEGGLPAAAAGGGEIPQDMQQIPAEVVV